ncbi:uncharacterized protein L969DRAFT_50335 [Mixia osmundae IAM 14324]|uniref:ferric-chelate reductase (NADPH) n=1 Tax=Mixia osmundae (strain CBS 9802 / IAM 14324 / JCM 22182 / KY 12970) TaxID=764103 RepID=G7E158_MIXOS|nr:uncharacterized protein L969DRAFT_50335 [Mixia osmundae IAM 14324]KEI38793.1 hypothetical protein L969DRAFT_50335 [Mixia osmundae IAM 14324]GAA96568.1 hypothetical protein E5Q_03237 [Mixia osmundae IAM 14324]
MQTKTDQQVTRSMEASDTLTDGRAWLAAQSRYTPYYLLFVLLIGLALGSIATVIKILTGDCSRRARNLHSEGSLDLQAHHAARLANVNVLLVIALASKNNAISWLTGLSYQTLNTLHRWAARVLLLLALVHIVLGFALQALDRLIRLARIIHHAYCSAITTEDAATITKLAGELLRVSVRTKMSWKPGQFVYLHLPAVAPGGHPFSVANIPSDNGDNQLELLIRAQGGLTRRLWNLPEQDRDLEKADSDSALRLRRCLIEGPYGAAEHTHHFASVLLISDTADYICLVDQGSVPSSRYCGSAL